MVADGDGAVLNETTRDEKAAIRVKTVDLVYAGAVACEMAYVDNGVGNMARAYLDMRALLTLERGRVSIATQAAANIARDKAEIERRFGLVSEEREVLLVEKDALEAELLAATTNLADAEALKDQFEVEALRNSRIAERLREERRALEDKADRVVVRLNDMALELRMAREKIDRLERGVP